MRWMQAMMGFFWTRTGMSSTKHVIYDSVDVISPVTSSNVSTPHLLNGILHSCRIMLTPLSTCNYENYSSSLMRNSLKTSRISERIKSCLSWVRLWGRVFRTMQMFFMDGEGNIVPSLCLFSAWILRYSGSHFFAISRT